MLSTTHLGKMSGFLAQETCLAVRWTLSSAPLVKFAPTPWTGLWCVAGLWVLERVFDGLDRLRVVPCQLGSLFPGRLLSATLGDSCGERQVLLLEEALDGVTIKEAVNELIADVFLHAFFRAEVAGPG